MKKVNTFLSLSWLYYARLLLLLALLTFLNRHSASAQSCSPLSTLPCEQLQVGFPFVLDFSSPVAGTLADKNGAGTGFTLVDAYSGSRHAEDGTPSNASVPGYEPSKLTLTGGQLQILTNKGIASVTNNNQLNALGVKVNSQNKLQVEVSLINPFNGTSYQQGGLWLGLNDKTYLKLVTFNNKVQLYKEFNDVSGSADNRLTAAISGLNLQTVRLRLIIDPAAQTAEGFYSTDGTNYVNVGSGYSTPALSIAGMGLTQSTAHTGLFATHRNGTTAQVYTFDDFSIQSLNVVQSCSPLSTLPCDQLQVNLPFVLNFNSPGAGSLADKNGAGTGFTLVDAYSGSRHAEDGTPSNTSVPGYEPSKLTLTGGQLQILTNKGIAYLTNNNQLNALGVKVNSQDKLQVEVSLLNPFNGTSSQQAGLWFGLSDKTFLKLVVTGNKVELRKELNDVSSSVSGTANPDHRLTAAISGLNLQTVRLRLIIDPATQTVEGFYSTDGTNYSNVGSGYSTPALSITGMGLTQSTAYTGIFASHRNATTAVTYTFEEFSIFSPSSGNRNAPVFSSDNYSFSLADNATPGTAAGNVSASDPDGDAVSYFITGGNTNGTFSIDAATGAIRVAKALNYHTQSKYTLSVKATDAGGLSALTTVAVTVTPGTNIPAFDVISWGTAASQPFSVYEGQGEVVGGKLYTFGGFNSQKPCCTPTNRAYVYDPAINKWNPIASMPPMNGTAFGGVTHAGFTTDGTDIFFAGGYTSNTAGTGQIFGTKEVWKYIVAENRYMRLPDLPVTISAGQLEYLNGRLHHIAGTNAARTADLDLHYVLDLDNLAAGWKPLAPLPNARQHAGSVVYEGKIYFIGGQKGHDNMLVTQKEVHQYDPLTNTWTQMADLPVPAGANGRSHISSAAIVVGNQIIVIGGETKHGTSVKLVSSFNPATNTWSELSPLPANRFSGVAANLGNNIYYTGGSNSSTTYKGLSGSLQVQSFTLINADTDQPIQTLTSGSTLNIATLPTRNLNIRANTSAGVGSVLFNLSGSQTRNFTDITAPYALFDDNNGNYTSWTPALGHYILKATPYDVPGSSGTAGPSFTINFAVTESQQSSTVDISPVTDGYIRDGSSAGLNFGFDSVLHVKGTTSTGNGQQVYLKFPVTGLSDVVSAKLRLYGRNMENSAAITATVYGVDNDTWTEHGLNWNNAPAPLATLLGTVAVNNQGRYYEVDVTTFVQAQFSKDKIVSLLIKDASTQNSLLAFNSREHALNPPQLIITTSATVPASKAQLFVENLDRFPSNEDYIASQIQVPWTRDQINYNTNHDTLRIRLHNKGMNPLVVSDLVLSSTLNWEIITLNGASYSAATALPFTITSGTAADLQVKFIPPDSAIRVRFLLDELAIHSNDDKAPVKTLYLRGLSQREGEGSKEPRAQEMINVFGFKSKTGFNASDPDKGASGKPKGDEVISSYFVRVDASRPVTVRQMGAYHGCCNASYAESIRWYPKGNTASLSTAASHVGEDAQRLLPRRNRSNTYTPSEGSFNPAGAFGFKIGNRDWTDTLLNPSFKIGIRVWKAIDKFGQVIANSYIVSNDYLGSTATNYDYNDNMYFVTNIRPELGPAAASLLTATPSAVDFGEQVLQSAGTFALSLQSLGQVYAGGVQDPSINITAVAITGENSSEFTASLPAKTLLNAGETTTLSISFTPTSEGLKVADLLIYYNNAASPLRVPLYGIGKTMGAMVTVPYRVKSGSAVDVTVNGKTWVADTPYAFDNLEPYSNAQLSQISATDEDVLYLREQSSNGDKKPFRYELPLQNGNYWIRLHFAEIYWGLPGGSLSGGAGSRVMSLMVENELRLVNLDVAREVGTAEALVKVLPVTVTDGKLNLNFSASTNRPMICAIEVFQFTSPIPLPLREEQTRNVRNSNKPLKVYPNPLRQRFTLSFPTVYKGVVQLQLVDMVGKRFELGRFQLRSGGSTLEMDLSRFGLPAGAYFLQVRSDTKTETLKLIIQ